MILIDELMKDGVNQSSVEVDVEGVLLKGWQIAKPLNYVGLSLSERWKMSKLIMDGKAIAVQYFEDLTEDEQQNYVKNKIREKDNFDNNLQKIK